MVVSGRKITKLLALKTSTHISIAFHVLRQHLQLTTSSFFNPQIERNRSKPKVYPTCRLAETCDQDKYLPSSSIYSLFFFLINHSRQINKFLTIKKPADLSLLKFVQAPFYFDIIVRIIVCYLQFPIKINFHF